MSDWKRTIQVAIHSALDEAGLNPIVRSARDCIASYQELIAEDPHLREFLSIDADLATLERWRSVRALQLNKDEAEVAERAGVPVYTVGYYRTNSEFRFQAPNEPRISAYTFDYSPEAWQQEPLAAEVERAVWIDRLIRALSGGLLTEGWVLYARALAHLSPSVLAANATRPEVEALQRGEVPVAVDGWLARPIHLPAATQALNGSSRVLHLPPHTVYIIDTGEHNAGANERLTSQRARWLKKLREWLWR